MAGRAERRHPPAGRFIEVDGVRLHYSDQGSGDPVVLVHGNATSGEDWGNSGVLERLLREHRVIIFDRPGCGHSNRPHDRMWTAEQQADLLRRAVRQLAVERPVIVGQSFGAVVALAYALRHPDDLAGVVLISGYYLWTLRLDVPLVAPAALPVIGAVLRHTILPFLIWLHMPLLKWAMFAPLAVPDHFKSNYATSMVLRPMQLRATSVDGALMIPSVLAMQAGYAGLPVPTVIIAGEQDKIVFKRNAERLQRLIPGSALHVVPDAGHMVHHAAPQAVVDAVRETRRDTAALASVKLAAD